MPIQLRGLSDRRHASAVLGVLLGLCPVAALADGAGGDGKPAMPPVLVQDRARPAGPGSVAAGHQAPQPPSSAVPGLPGAARPADLWRAVSVTGGQWPVPAVTDGGDTDEAIGGAIGGAMPVVSSVFVARRETPFIDRVNRLKLKAGSGEENIWLLGLGWRVDFAGGGR